MIHIQQVITNNDNTKNIIIGSSEGREIRLHSSRPLAESDKLFSQLPANSPAYFLGGLGCGYLLEKILSQYNSTCVVYEPISPIFDTAIQARPELKTMLQDKRVILVRELSDLTEIVQKHSLTNISFTINRTYSQLFPQEFQQIKDYLASGIRRQEIGNATLARFGKLWTKNMIRNLHRYFTSRPLNSYKSWAKDKPAIIIGAGPSLEESLEYIKAHQDQAILIACDTALPMLHNANINPDFVVTVDPQEKNSLYLRYTPKKKHYLIADPSIHDSGFEGYEPSQIILTDSIFPTYLPFKRFWNECGLLASGGSVSTSAFDFARYIESDPIILVGQDLSFTEKKTHNNGNILTEFSLTRHNRLNSFYQQHAFTTYPIHVQQIKGRIPSQTVSSDARLVLFRDWFSQEIPKTKASVIVAGMQGAWLEGASHKEIHQAFAVLQNTINKTHPSFVASNSSTEYNNFIQQIIKQISIVLPHCQTLSASIQKAHSENNLEAAANSSKQLQDLLSQKNNQILNNLLSTSMQSIIQNSNKTSQNLDTKQHISLLLSISQETITTLKQLKKLLSKSSHFCS